MSTLPTAAQEWDLWSTRARLVVTDPALLPAARELADGLLAEVELAASRFRPDAEVVRLTPGPNGTVSLSPLLSDLVGVALRAARDSGGAVDPTVGSTLADLGYDRDIREVRLAERGGRPVAVVRRVPGWRTLELTGRQLRLPAGLQLDLGATAKARAADLVAEAVATRLGTGALVALGGDIATVGPAPAGGWQVHVQDAADDPDDHVALPAGAAVATSSTTRRTWLRGGRTVTHLVDPGTSRPIEPVWRSVTVAAATCTAANTASTATLVKGRGGLAWLTARGLPARLVGLDGRVHTLGGWPSAPPDPLAA